jgi:hypothetical protein
LFQPCDAHDFEIAVPFETTLEAVSDVAQFPAFIWQEGEYNMRVRSLKPNYTRPLLDVRISTDVFD